MIGFQLASSVFIGATVAAFVLRLYPQIAAAISF